MNTLVNKYSKVFLHSNIGYTPLKILHNILVYIMCDMNTP